MLIPKWTRRSQGRPERQKVPRRGQAWTTAVPKNRRPDEHGRARRDADQLGRLEAYLKSYGETVSAIMDTAQSLMGNMAGATSPDDAGGYYDEGFAAARDPTPPAGLRSRPLVLQTHAGGGECLRRRLLHAVEHARRGNRKGDRTQAGQEKRFHLDHPITPGGLREARGPPPSSSSRIPYSAGAAIGGGEPDLPAGAWRACSSSSHSL